MERIARRECLPTSGEATPWKQARSGSPKSFFINKQDMISKILQKSDKNNNFSKRLTKDE
jgi:hypothetical protein